MEGPANTELIEHGPAPEPLSMPIRFNSDAAQLMSVIAHAASDPTTDVDKLDRLLGMYERIKANEARAAFAAALADAKSEMPIVLRDRPNEQTKSRYSTLEAIAAAIDPVISKHGFVPSFGSDLSPVEGCYRVTCELLHRAGHSRSYFVDVPADLTGMKGTVNKTKTHAYASTLTYGRRILKTMIFDVASSRGEDDDGNAASGEVRVINEQELTELRAAIALVDVNPDTVCSYAKVDKLEEITNLTFAKVLDAVKRFKGKPKQDPTPEPTGGEAANSTGDTRPDADQSGWMD